MSRSFFDSLKSHQCRQRKIEKKKKVSPQNLRPSTRIRWEITSTVTSAQHVKYKCTLIRFTRWISWSQLRTKPTLRLRLSHFFWRFQPKFKVKEKICLGNTDKKATTLRLWNLTSTKLNYIFFSFVFATWLPLWREPIKGRMKQRISPRICLFFFISRCEDPTVRWKEIQSAPETSNNWIFHAYFF